MRIEIEAFVDEQDGRDHIRVREFVVHELTDREAARIARALAERGIRVEPVVDPFNVLNLWALAPLTVRQEITAIAAYAKVTDARIAWHEAVAGA